MAILKDLAEVISDLRVAVEEILVRVSNAKVPPEQRIKELANYLQLIDEILEEGKAAEELTQHRKNQLDAFIKKEQIFKPYADLIRYWLDPQQNAGPALPILLYKLMQTFTTKNLSKYREYCIKAYQAYIKYPQLHNGYIMGLCLSRGWGVKKDINQAIKILELAKDDTAANFLLLELYSHSKEQKHIQQLAKCLARTKEGDFEYYIYLARNEYSKWQQYKQDRFLESARNYYYKGYAQGGSFESLYELAALEETQGNYAQAVKYCLLEPDFYRTSHLLYQLQAEGKTDAYDYTQALSYLNTACERNYAPALYDYGVLCYQNSQLTYAAHCINMAAAQGHAQALGWMGWYLEQERDQPSTTKTIIDYYESANYKGDYIAGYRLAKLYLRINEIKASGEIIAIALNFAKEQLSKKQIPLAQAELFYWLAKLYLLNKQDKLAFEFFKKAIDLGHNKALIKLNMLQAPITVSTNATSHHALLSKTFHASALMKSAKPAFIDTPQIDATQILEQAQILYNQKNYWHALKLLETLEKYPFTTLSKLQGAVLQYDIYSALQKANPAKLKKHIALTEAARQNIINYIAVGLLNPTTSKETAEELKNYQAFYVRPEDLADAGPSFTQRHSLKESLNKPSVAKETVSASEQEPIELPSLKETAAKPVQDSKKPNKKNRRKKQSASRAKIEHEPFEKPSTNIKATLTKPRQVDPISNSELPELFEFLENLTRNKELQNNEFIKVLLKNSTQIRYLFLVIALSGIDAEKNYGLLYANNILYFLLHKNAEALYKGPLKSRNEYLITSLLRESFTKNISEQFTSASLLLAGLCWGALENHIGPKPLSTYRDYENCMTLVFDDLKFYLQIPKYIEDTVRKIWRITLYQLKMYTDNPFIFINSQGAFVKAIIFGKLLFDANQACPRPTAQPPSFFSSAANNSALTIKATTKLPAAVNFRPIDDWSKVLNISKQQGINYLIDYCKGRIDVIPLQILAVYGEVELARALLEKPDMLSLLNQQDLNGRTALHQACAFNRMSFIALLLEFKAEINIMDKSGNKALHLANLGVIKQCLLQFTAFKSIPPHIQLLNIWQAARMGYSALAVFLLERGDADFAQMYTQDLLDASGKSLLHYAVENRSLNLVAALMARAYPLLPDAKNRTPVELATIKGFDEIVEQLILYSSRPTTQQRPML